MSNDLDALMQIRQNREEQALSQVAERRNQAQLRLQKLERKRAELNSYIEWKQQQERELFSSLVSRPVPASELQAFRASMNSMLERQLKLAQELAQEQQLAAEAETALSEAKVKLGEKCRETARCQELLSETEALTNLKRQLKETEDNDELALSQWINGRKDRTRGVEQ